MKRAGALVALCLAVAVGRVLVAQTPTQPLDQTALQRDPLRPAPNRAPGEGLGPYNTMVIRGAMLIDGTGGPPRGPVDIVVENNRIAAIRTPARRERRCARTVRRRPIMRSTRRGCT